MNEKYKNQKYIVWLYNVTAREYTILKNHFPEEHFDVVDIQDDLSKFDTIEKMNLLDKPDILICDENVDLNNDIKNILYKAYCGIARVTTKNLSNINTNIFELNNDEINNIQKKNSQYINITTTKLEYSIKKIIEICQLSNIEKLQKIANQVAERTLHEIDIDKETTSGKSFSFIAKEYLFKLAYSLNQFISFKDHYTAGHCERVAYYSEALGHELDLNDDEIEDLILSAYLHDIGKIALPDAVITKTTQLNDLEYQLMQKHVELGSSILPSEQFGRIKNAVRDHHEKYDGTGYPDNLKGDDIPFFAQILAIADSFDAMTSQRSYNKVKSVEEAFEDLILHTKPRGIDGGLGIHYNPYLVVKFIKVISNSKTIMGELKNNKKIADENAKLKIQQDLEKEKIDFQYKKKKGI